MSDAATRFTAHFIAELRAAGHRAADIAQWVWKPYHPAELPLLGPGRDRGLARIQLSAAEVEAIADPPSFAPLGRDFYRQQKLALVLVPGFTHETLRNLSWHEQIEDRRSPHHIVMLKPGWQGEAPQEETYAQGDGLKLMYVRYPRSNAGSQHIVPALAEMLQRSPSLRRWVQDEGRKLVFVGYSYGAPLSLELLAALKDDFIVPNTRAFLGLCGDIGGSYLADDVLRPDAQLLNIQNVVAFCRRHRFIGKLAGLGTEQLLNDMEDGVRSLGHEVRQRQARDYARQLPAQVKYFSVSAVMPLADYRRRWWQFNLDDYTMYRQALVTDPITVYQDGQVALPDNWVPEGAPNHTHLGAVRTHHWGVSYKTFNLGNNRFPRPAFYRALLRSVLAETA